MAAKRIYQVYSNATALSRLVRATSRAQAVGHVARSSFEVAVADQDTLVALLKKGIEVEDASAE